MQGDFTHSEEQSYSDTLTRTALNGDTFTQSVSDSPTIMTTGNSVAGLTTATQTGEMSYSFTQTTSAYELSGSGVKPYEVISHADANSGLADRTETGTDDYTLTQTGTSGTKAFTLTVTGSDTYSLTTNSNSQDGGFTQTLTATGSHSRVEHGDNNGTPYSLSDTDDHSFDQLQTGNDVDAQTTQTTSGTTRYDLLIDFSNPVESVTTGEGVTLFMAIGAPQALIRDTMAPTGTMSDAGDIDHAYCFAKGTLVLMADGSRKPIETIVPGEEVLAVDENDPEGKPQSRKVVQTYHNAPAQIWHVKVNGEVIRTTAGHPFYVKGKGWVKVAELHPDDELRDIEGKTQKVESVEVTNAVEPVFNLNVESGHTYFVAMKGGAEIWVHNTSDEELEELWEKFKKERNRIGQFESIDIDEDDSVKLDHVDPDVVRRLRLFPVYISPPKQMFIGADTRTWMGSNWLRLHFADPAGDIIRGIDRARAEAPTSVFVLGQLIFSTISARAMGEEPASIWAIQKEWAPILDNMAPAPYTELGENAQWFTSFAADMAMFYAPAIAEARMVSGAALENASIKLDSNRALKLSINGYDANDPLHANFEKVVRLPGVFDVGGHGDKVSIVIKGVEHTPKSLAKEILNAPKYYGQEVRLLSCEVGFIGLDRVAFAEQLAQELGNHVWATGRAVWIKEDGRIGVGNFLEAANKNATHGKHPDFVQFINRDREEYFHLGFLDDIDF